jgi:hypothetical protein
MSRNDPADAEPHQRSDHRDEAPAIVRDADLMFLRTSAEVQAAKRALERSKLDQILDHMTRNGSRIAGPFWL